MKKPIKKNQKTPFVDGVLVGIFIAAVIAIFIHVATYSSSNEKKLEMATEVFHEGEFATMRYQNELKACKNKNKRLESRLKNNPSQKTSSTIVIAQGNTFEWIGFRYDNDTNWFDCDKIKVDTSGITRILNQ